MRLVYQSYFFTSDLPGCIWTDIESQNPQTAFQKLLAKWLDKNVSYQNILYLKLIC